MILLFGDAIMRKPLQIFVHRPSVHCESSALRDIFEFYGFKFSEAMIFGLGSGLGFIYWHGKNIYIHLWGRSRDLCKNLCDNLGVTVRVNKTACKKRAYEAVKELIGKNVPVMVHVDMLYLKYLGLPQEAHFGAHTVVIAGIDDSKRVAYIADTGFKKLQTAILKELEDARGSKFKPFPPQNKLFVFQFPSNLTSLNNAIKKGMMKTVETMLHPPIKNLGARGIRYFASEILKWPQLCPSESPRFKPFYEVTYVMLEEDGTGGGCFRYLYSKFLKESGEHLDKKELANLGERYWRVGEKWTRVARLVRGIPSNSANCAEAKEILLEIAEQEEEILSSLEKLF